MQIQVLRSYFPPITQFLLPSASISPLNRRKSPFRGSMPPDLPTKYEFEIFKNLSPQNGRFIRAFLCSSQSPMARNFARFRGVRLFFSNKTFLKSSKSRFKLKKVWQRRYLLSKIHLSGFFKKTISFRLVKVTLKSLKQPFLGFWQTLKSKFFLVFMKNIWFCLPGRNSLKKAV